LIFDALSICQYGWNLTVSVLLNPHPTSNSQWSAPSTEHVDKDARKSPVAARPFVQAARRIAAGWPSEMQMRWAALSWPAPRSRVAGPDRRGPTEERRSRSADKPLITELS